MKRVIDVVKNRDAAGVYRLAGDAPLDEIVKKVRELGYAVFLIEGDAIRDKDDFLASIARTLQFPPYFGANWDALEDCLTDMSWIEGDSFVIVCTSLNRFSSQHPRDFATALDIFKDAGAFWKSQGGGFFVLLAGNDPERSDLESLDW